MKKREMKDLSSFKSMLDRTTCSDFDGHTDFNRMSPEERLLWLSQCARFVSVVRSSGEGSGS